MDLFGRKKDNSMAISIVSSAVGAAVGAVTAVLLMEPKNRKALSDFVSNVLDTTSKKGTEVIDMTTKALEKNGRRKSRSSETEEENV